MISYRQSSELPCYIAIPRHMCYRTPPRGPIEALLRMGLTIWIVVVLTERLGWPVVPVYLTLVFLSGPCFVEKLVKVAS
jgi:hypothetical protein